jgi:hypothetical protein
MPSSLSTSNGGCDAGGVLLQALNASNRNGTLLRQ